MGMLSEEATTESFGSGKKAGDVVEMLLADEAVRKKQLERQQQEEKEAADKLGELRMKSKDELLKLLKKKGLESTGKKEASIAMLYAEFLADQKLVARKAELIAMGKDGVKEICARKGLAISGKLEGMIKSVLDYEKQCREKLKEYEAKYDIVAAEFVAKKKEELMQKTASELKEMLTSKDLKVGVGKDERIDRLLQDLMKQTKEIDKVVGMQFQEARRTELLGMEKKALRILCEQHGAEPVVKEVAIQRILDAEESSQLPNQELRS